jgi:surface protein
MFDGASSFNQDISKWNVSNITDMECMFCRASAFNQDISKWDVSCVIDMNSIFWKASSFNQDISGWNVSCVTYMNLMFYEASSFNQDISQWDVSNVRSMFSMFQGSTTFINGPHLQELENWNVSGPEILNNLLGYGKSISFRRRYLISWDEWINKHPTKISSEADLRSSEADLRSSEADLRSSEYTCPICLTDLTTDETWRAISCPATINQGIPHCFHKECIEGCFNMNQNKTCPVCCRNAIAIKEY